MTQPARALDRLIGAAGSRVLSPAGADVGHAREQRRRARWLRLAGWTWGLVALLWWRALAWDGAGGFVPLPTIDPFLLTIVVFFGLLLAMAVGQQVVSGRSPHVLFRPEQITTTLDDVVGIDPVKDDVVRSLNLFLAHRTFRDEMGGTPRRALLFEGPPGTGKTHLARAMAGSAGVPFLFVSATSFQSMWFGATAKKIRSYFRALRKAARKEGGAIGFIEEIDAIAMTRGGVSSAVPYGLPARPLTAVLGCCHGTASLPATYAAPAGPVTSALASTEGTGGVVNELLVQMQSFDDPTVPQRLRGWLVDRVNLLLPPQRQLRRPAVTPSNILLIAATNRAEGLDPALLRPGRFDRRVSFELPDKSGRRLLVDHFLARKAHAPALDDPAVRDTLAAVTQGYTPVMVEHLLDEALVNAVRRGDTALSWADVERARMVEQVGLAAPVDYTDHERRLIATHEAGHATAAWLTAPHRRLEVLTIVKRRSSLGLLSHGDREDVFTRSRTEMRALVQIALAGQCAEEIFFGDVSTGPGGDLLYATNAAAEMVGAHGMDESLLSYAAITTTFADTNLVGRVLADDRGRDAVERLLQTQKVAVKALLEAHRHLVEALRDALLEREELIGTEITDVLERATAAPRVLDLTGRVPSPPRS
ncbi:MAG: Cell division protein FtsH [uncultured Frankineae bacterium]|uniref:Cell division protein FtsH n=1 Tax=uncultured Frankineae bacterium TaxID=437475 RepID=A0A6J4KFJ7_9ACTN|nr:MAG: Cell division protein FtsH [uncultured Frankineae bacterium]